MCKEKTEERFKQIEEYKVRPLKKALSRLASID